MKKILIVEDEAPLLSVLHDKLVQEGYRVLAAKNGKEGLAVALSEHPDLILLDILLPDMNGLAVLKEIHSDDWGKNAKVIMLTNLSDNQSVADSLEQGSFDFLVKSDWKLEDVAKVIRDKLKD